MLPPLESVFNLTNLDVPLDEILRGRQPKDGIKALTDPTNLPARKGDLPGSSEPGRWRECRWHLAGLPDQRAQLARGDQRPYGKTDLAITYCSLCDSVAVVDRRLDGKTYQFGISCLIYRSNMLLYDRTDQALWSQMTSSAMSGPQAGRTLRHIDGWELTTFGPWRASHPDSTVVSFATGYDHPYRSDLHRDYFATDELDSRFQDLPLDGRLRNKARIIGVKSGAEARAYPIDVLQESARVTIRDQIDGSPVEFCIDAGTGAVRILHAPEEALVVHTFWFAWAARFPETGIYQRTDERQGTL